KPLYMSAEKEEPKPFSKESGYLPKFAGEKRRQDPTIRGNAYHRALELLPMRPDYDLESLSSALEELKSTGKLTEEEAAFLNLRSLLSFFKTPLAKRLSAASTEGTLFREQPFVLGIPASRLQPDFPSEEILLVQGIIDVYFEEDGELVVLDYKTDRVTQPEELVQRYQIQLDYYAEALRRLTGKKVRQKLIYSFVLQKEITL
ncbi:MAG: PD-(D/E)XK nuclease family protein, partial [Lachnospiraceae bacterium]|nr:PD-(D/E)XK nuclease family protein [Lachnospiraceae bacterium]